MKIADIFCHDVCQLNLELNNKHDVLAALGRVLYQKKRIKNQTRFMAEVKRREALGITYIGNHIAIPHCQSDTVKQSSIVISKTANLIDWDKTMDFKVQYVVLFAVPACQQEQSTLILLTQVIELLTEIDFLQQFTMTRSGGEVLQLFKQYLH